MFSASFKKLGAAGKVAVVTVALATGTTASILV